MTVEEIIRKERRIKNTNGDYGLQACKEAIMFQVKNNNADLYDLLKQYAERANNDIFFNRTMVLACWELINGKD